jgi:hypothetical protein
LGLGQAFGDFQYVKCIFNFVKHNMISELSLSLAIDTLFSAKNSYGFQLLFDVLIIFGNISEHCSDRSAQISLEYDTDCHPDNSPEEQLVVIVWMAIGVIF